MFNKISCFSPQKMSKKKVCSGKYYHEIVDQNISSESTFESCECTGELISFVRCIFFGFPSAKSIKNHGNKIEDLIITDSKLSRVSAYDLRGFNFLKCLYIRDCEIDELPADLFKNTPRLELINFHNNKIKFIGENLLNPLRSLKFFDLRGNTNIDYIYNSYSNIGSLEELTAKVNVLDKKYSEASRQEIVALKARCDELQNRVITGEDAREAIEKELNNQKRQIEDFGNFVVMLNGKKFKINKKILTKHSKTIAQMIDEKPDAESLELRDISEETFKHILNFFKTGNPPNENANWVELFAASCKLEVDALSAIVALNLEEKVNPENSLEVVNVCNNYNKYEELKMIAFAEFAKNFPHQNLNLELASDPEMLKNLKIKLEMDKLLAEM
jgi:BTB/POZ domain/Leucine rich repeat